MGYFERTPAPDDASEYYRKHGIETWIDCECVARRRVARLMETSNITSEFRQKGFKNFTTDGRPPIVAEAKRVAIQYAKDYISKFPALEGKRRSVALLGRPGCGKTHLLMAVANNLIDSGVQVTYFPWVEGFNELKDDFDRLESRVTALKRTEVLFIDDLFKGRDKPTSWQIEQLFGIVNARYLEGRPMLISSERSIIEMCGYDEAIGSRINEMCRGYKVTLEGGPELNYRLID